MKSKQEYDQAVAQLRKRIDEQAARLGEVAQVLDALFEELDELEAEMESGMAGIPQLQDPDDAANQGSD
ncbi:hypothetical protein [Caldimonas tepidiphila]|uniref:hypothetical protein n=1 Tax=Caldimonas tepidiphila TaxID=2315841 RepID=UPI000E5B4B92|nr:hypothetical protein [Caldimonas tepidiphila]